MVRAAAGKSREHGGLLFLRPWNCARSALLLQDFGKPGHDYEGAIDVNSLLGTIKNSPAVEQMFLFDCCRTKADDLYQNEERIGSRIVNVKALRAVPNTRWRRGIRHQGGPHRLYALPPGRLQLCRCGRVDSSVGNEYGLDLEGSRPAHVLACISRCSDPK
jgi:hypothetical protein